MKIEDLQRGNTSLSRDNRKIKNISFENENSYWIGHGSDVTAIIAYDENGEASHVPWVAVFKGEFLYSRIPARQLAEIIYEDNHD